MKAFKTFKTVCASLAIAAFSLTAMAFTAAQIGVCVEQNITFDDGRTVRVYYVQEGNNYALYSADDLLKFKPRDVYHIEDNNFSIGTTHEGQCYYRAESLQEALDMANTVFSQFKPKK